MPEYTKIHLELDKDRFESLKQDGHYHCIKKDHELWLAEITPDPVDAVEWIKAVGKPYKWDKRKGFIEDVKRAVSTPQSLMFLFMKNENPIGVAVIADPALSTDHQDSIEIFKIGLLPSQTNSGHGSFLLLQLFERLFERSSNVYLNTRDTNHSKVVPFYEAMGMLITNVETCSSDVKGQQPITTTNRYRRDLKAKIA
jgi:ribosomal protein S18 acetylase RimI-like enzyme